MRRDVGMFLGGMLAGMVCLLVFGEAAGSRLMRLGAHMRNASATVNEYDGLADMQYIENVPSVPNKRRK